MLIRMNGGRGGIKDYLENGQKQDRYFSRDELDERLILSGDLNTVDSVINAIDNKDVKRERYFHITLSFKEDYIDEQILNDIASDFREFYFKAYSDDELSFYAEAHLPKIKSYLDAKTGEVIDRKPHIHVVVPKINLVTGNTIDFYDPDNIKHIDAFQEHINAKYGLESPKDNPRYNVNDNSEFISRYKGDGFKGKHKEVREQIFEDIIQNNISSFSQLESHLNANGYQVKIRNQGKGVDKEYFNIIDQHGISINLRDKVFQQQFLSLENKDKIITLKSDISYIEPKPQGKTDAAYSAVLSQWDSFKAYEYKYVNSVASSTERAKYNKLSDEDKHIYIQEKIQNFNSKYLGDLDGRSIERDDRNNDSGEFVKDYIDVVNQNIRSADETIESAGVNLRRNCIDQAKPIGRERRRRIAERYAGIIGEYRLQDSRDTKRSGTDKPEHQTNKEQDIKRSVVDESVKSVNNTANKELNAAKIKDFNTEINADVLLELLEKTHSVNPEIYRITKASDGTDRIGCGSRNYTLMDFCQKEMYFSLSESINYLDNVLAMQKEVNRERGWSRDDTKYLTDEYKDWFKSYKSERAKVIFEQKNNFKEKRQNIHDEFKTKIAEIREDKKLRYNDKRDKINILKLEKILAIDSLNKVIKSNNFILKNQYNLEMQDAYKTFLSRKAKDNDEIALQELRRLRINFKELVNCNSITYVDRYEEFKLNITHNVDKDGVINYQLKGKTVIKDHGKRVSIVKHSEQNVKLTLDLAKAKFGKNVSLTGSEKFRQKAVDIAIKNNMQINFTDNFSREYYKKQIAELQKNDNYTNKQKQELISDKPKLLFVSSKDQLVIASDNGRTSTVNTLTLTDYNSKKTYTVTGYKINFNNLQKGHFVEYSIGKDGDLILKESTINKQVGKIKSEIINTKSEAVKSNAKDKYGVKDLKDEFTGSIVRTGSYKNKFYAVFSVNGEFKKVWGDSLKTQLESQGASKGDVVTVVIPKSENVRYDDKIKVVEIKKADNILDDILLELDLELDKKDYKREYYGRILEAKQITLKSGQQTNLVIISDTLSGQLTKIYMNDIKSLKPNDFAYLGERSYNNFEVTIVNEKLQAKRALILAENNVKDAAIGNIAKIGYKDIRGKEVYFTELRTDHGIITKYGEGVKEQVEINKLRVGDSVVVTTTELIKDKYKEEDIIVATRIDKDIDQNIDDKLEQIVTEIENEVIRDSDDGLSL